MSRLIMAIDANKCMNCKACVIEMCIRDRYRASHDVSFYLVEYRFHFKPQRNKKV